MPGADLNHVRTWADLLQRLVSSKSGSKPKLSPTDLSLDWRPLWRILQKELWPKKRAINTGRNAVNLLLYVAEKCKRHFPSSEIPSMLDTFITMFTKNVSRIMLLIWSLLTVKPEHINNFSHHAVLLAISGRRGVFAFHLQVLGSGRYLSLCINTILHAYFRPTQMQLTSA